MTRSELASCLHAYRPDVAARFMSRVAEPNEDGCLLWIGALTHQSYGRLRATVGGRLEQFNSHRFAFAAARGPVPHDLVIDHVCRVRNCVNPDHLRAVTNRENLMAGEGFGARNAAKTHCPKGHAYTPENTIRRQRRRGLGWIQNARICRVCERARKQRLKRRARERREALDAA